jgi:translin
MNELKREIESISEKLAARQNAFDKAMDFSRKLVRIAAQSITNMHNGKEEEAKKKLLEAKRIMERIIAKPEFYYHTMQSMQEYAEASIFFGIKFDKMMLSREDVGVPEDAYINGLMDTVGELKRELVESLSQGDKKEAKRYYVSMVEIFDATREVRFAEAVLPGFRRKQDVARIQIESAASEILRNK